MDFDAWTGMYRKLCAAKEHAVSGQQSAAYFEVLREHPAPCVEAAVLRACRDVAGWPKVDKLVELARDERRKVQAPAEMCDRCHGAGWVDAPDVELNGVRYRYMADRCPQCWRQTGAA